MPLIFFVCPATPLVIFRDICILFSGISMCANLQTNHVSVYSGVYIFLVIYSTVSGTYNGPLYMSTVVQNPVAVYPIPGTWLYTGIYYKLGLQRFPSGTVTSTDLQHPVGKWYYMSIDARDDDWESYQKDGIWFNDAQWFFDQTNTTLGWYTLRNRQLPKSVAWISRDEKVDRGYPVALKENIGNPIPTDALWRPVLTQGQNDTNIYKLILQSEPEASISWSQTLVNPNESDCYFIQVDVNIDNKVKYAEKGDWFIDTLFRFEPVDIDVVRQLQHDSVSISTKVSNPVTFSSNITSIETKQFVVSNYWGWQSALILIIIGLVCVVVVAVYLVKWQNSKFQLMAEEVNEFFNGAMNNNNLNETGANKALSIKYDKSRYEIADTLYTIDESTCLGSGEFGIVYSAVLNPGQIQAAAKTLKRRSRTLDHSAQAALKGLISEIKILSYLGDHENIVKLYGANTTRLRSGSVFLFLEMCKLGSLASYLRNPIQNGNTKNSPETVDDIYEDLRYGQLKSNLWQWSKEIATGMAFLSSKQLIHADLATRNILLDSNKTAKISDFGLSRRLYDYTHYVKTSQEPLPWRWMAPESLRKNEFCEKTDVWAYGITLWEIYTLGDTPYPGLTWDVNFPTMLEKGLKPGPPKYNERNIYQIMLQCWAIKPEKRPTFSMLLSSDWNTDQF